MKKLFILPIALLLFISSCSTESEDGMNQLPAKDVTYTATIKVIIDDNCLNCHVNPPINGASMSLITLENVSDAILNRGLIGRVESGSMPPVGDYLTDTQVQALKDWQTGGFQE